ncbi:hypothetical protein HJFPF1_06721 [Paramyrothecium foliicola]|nr:hypothetical protein HJFPF1_06721 [Paramyrothecium foliicola]
MGRQGVETGSDRPGSCWERGTRADTENRIAAWAQRNLQCNPFFSDGGAIFDVGYVDLGAVQLGDW